MILKKLFVISDSPVVQSIFNLALADFHTVETIRLDSFFSAEKLLEQYSTTLDAISPDVILIDLSTARFPAAAYSEQTHILVQ